MRRATPSICTEASGHLPASGSPGGCGFPTEVDTRKFGGAGVLGCRTEPDNEKISVADAIGCIAGFIFTEIELNLSNPVKLGPRTAAQQVADIDDLIDSFRPEGGRS